MIFFSFPLIPTEVCQLFKSPQIKIKDKDKDHSAHPNHIMQRKEVHGEG